MAARKKWSGLSSRSRKLILVTGVVEVALLAATLIGLEASPRRSGQRLEAVWTAVAFVDIIGPIAHFSLGRRRGAGVRTAG